MIFFLVFFCWLLITYLIIFIHLQLIGSLLLFLACSNYVQNPKNMEIKCVCFLMQTVDAGCKPYMAPERIDPSGNPSNYDVRWQLPCMLEYLKCRINKRSLKWSTWYRFYYKEMSVHHSPKNFNLLFSHTFSRWLKQGLGKGWGEQKKGITVLKAGLTVL